MKIKRFPLGQLWTNCYVVWDENRDGFIVDPGGPAAEVRDFVEKNKIRVSWILITHGHSDHIGGVSDVRSLSRHGVAIHLEDADCLTNADRNMSKMWGDAVSAPEADKILNDKDKLAVGTMSIEVIHTPGHTRGGVCFYVKDSADGSSLLFSGDTLFARSVGRTDLPGGDEDAIIDSLTRLDPLPDSLEVYPGHGPETTIGDEKKYNPYWPR